MVKTENTLIHYKQKWYHTVYMREKRYKTLRYFDMFNKWQIYPRHLNESKIFNATDLYYIKEINKKV